MGQVAQQLGGALRPGTADVGPVLVPGHRRPAHRADGGQQVGDSPLGALLLHHGHNLRDDLPRLLHDHPVPDADILFRNKVLVVEGGVGDGGARQPDGGNHRLGGEHPGAAHLNHDVLHHALLLLRRVLVSRRPAGKFGGLSQRLTL